MVALCSELSIWWRRCNSGGTAPRRDADDTAKIAIYVCAHVYAWARIVGGSVYRCASIPSSCQFGLCQHAMAQVASIWLLTSFSFTWFHMSSS